MKLFVLKYATYILPQEEISDNLLLGLLLRLTR